LSHYHLGSCLRTLGLILDTSGHLSELQPVVSREFARRCWVYERCKHAKANDCFNEGYKRLLCDLGITSISVLRRRNEQVGEQLSDVWNMAEAIIAANRDIED
jgi:hypothetical protein